MKPLQRLVLAFFIFSVASCSTSRHSTPARDDGKIEVVFVQVNDVYEIAPLANGKEGGMARVATLKKQYAKTNPNTFLVMAGDFVSPSVYNSLQYEGKRIRGRQMIEAMNAAGMDIAIFGNHEFDITESELQDRINESAFQWISSNSFHKQNAAVMPFVKTTPPYAGNFPKTKIITVHDKDGTTAKIGFLALTLPFNRADYVSYTEPLITAKELYIGLKDSVDAVVAITHQSVEDDKHLAQQLPGLAMILGGHEHDMRFEKEGNVYITKAHANARSAYIVTLDIDKRKKKWQVTPTLKYLNESVPLDSSTNKVVQKWTEIADKNYSTLGFDARKIVLSTGEPLDGREISVRSGPTNLTRLITAAMGYAVPNADVVLLNAGSIRVDDVVPMPITQYDILRTLPFGGGIREADMKGVLLQKILAQGRLNKDIGGFLLYNEAVKYDAATNSWTINGTPVDPNKIYHVGVSEFLLSGKEANLDFLNPNNPDIIKVYDAATGVGNPKADIRLAVVQYLEKK